MSTFNKAICDKQQISPNNPTSKTLLLTTKLLVLTTKTQRKLCDQSVINPSASVRPIITSHNQANNKAPILISTTRASSNPLPSTNFPRPTTKKYNK